MEIPNDSDGLNPVSPLINSHSKLENESLTAQNGRLISEKAPSNADIERLSMEFGSLKATIEKLIKEMVSMNATDRSHDLVSDVSSTASKTFSIF